MKFIVTSLRSQKMASMCLGIDLRETKRHHSKHSTPFHARLHSMLYKLHTSMIKRHPLLIKEKSAVGRICKFRLPMEENSFKTKGRNKSRDQCPGPRINSRGPKFASIKIIFHMQISARKLEYMFTIGSSEKWVKRCFMTFVYLY